MLDIGAGLRLACPVYRPDQTGCRVSLVDIPEGGAGDGAGSASGRNADVQIACRNPRPTDAAKTGFPDARFDAVTHSDVLCCLPHKEAVLDECRRVLKPTGAMLFSVIYVPEELSPGDKQRGIDAGPEFVASGKGYREMLREAGWKIVGEEDVTAALRAAYETQVEADLAHQSDLVSLLGMADVQARIDGWRMKIAAIITGCLRRAIFHVQPAER